MLLVTDRKRDLLCHIVNPPLLSIATITYVLNNLFLIRLKALLSTTAVRGSKTIKTVQLTENEVRNLCLKSSEIFLNQPILLELEAPLKICGEPL